MSGQRMPHKEYAQLVFNAKTWAEYAARAQAEGLPSADAFYEKATTAYQALVAWEVAHYPLTYGQRKKAWEKAKTMQAGQP